MKAININTSLVDNYYAILKSLSPNNKLELISRLSNSMKITQKENDEISLDALYGSWDSDNTADDIIAELKSARSFTRKQEVL